MKYIAILFTLFIITIIILADKNALPPFVRAIYDFPNGDKFGHFILLDSLALFSLSLFSARFPTKPAAGLLFQLA